jgi:hypothetical protein
MKLNLSLPGMSLGIQYETGKIVARGVYGTTIKHTVERTYEEGQYRAVVIYNDEVIGYDHWVGLRVGESLSVDYHP